MFELPVYVWALALSGVAGILVTTGYVLYRGGVAVGLSRTRAVALGLGALTVLGGWMAVSALLARGGVYLRDSGDVTPWLGVASTGVLAAVLLASRVPVISRILAHPGALPLLVLPNSLRIFGVAFLVTMVLGRLPAVFAVPAGLGDMAVGVAAPFLALRLARGDRRGAARFHLLGVLDLVVALGIGYFAGLGPFPLIDVTPSTDTLGTLPLVLIPTVAVPLVIGLHLLSLRRIREIGRSGAATPEPLAATG